MQDVAGCRLVVQDLAEQDDVVERLSGLPWDRHRVFDRRATPSHGYRAVHVIVTTMDRHVEVQVRTALQDQWAQLSERLADRFGLDVKYGAGPPEARDLLGFLSELVMSIELNRHRNPDLAEVRYLEAEVKRLLSQMLGTLAR
jgi:putative GTP pyrophosphokinase